jgi:transposase
MTTPDIPLRCPRCGSMNKPPPAKPTLELEPDGTVSCSACAFNWKPQ